MSDKTPDGRSRSSTDATHACEMMEKKTLSRSLTQPKGTIEYVVGSTDTLSSIAARHETTPSELTKLNRLTNRMIVPGQVLYVPKHGGKPVAKTVTPTNSPVDRVSCDSLELSPKPGHVKRVHSPIDSSNESQLSSSEITTTQLSETSKEQKPFLPQMALAFQSHSKQSRIDPADRECLERFLKINARHITDGQGVVCGVLLVTPNALMFDPNVSDPLVIEHGAEYYGVTVPMEMVLKTAMYSDIAHMRVKHAPEAMPSAPRPEVYYGDDELENQTHVIQSNISNMKVQSLCKDDTMEDKLLSHQNILQSNNTNEPSADEINKNDSSQYESEVKNNPNEENTNDDNFFDGSLQLSDNSIKDETKEVKDEDNSINELSKSDQKIEDIPKDILSKELKVVSCDKKEHESIARNKVALSIRHSVPDTHDRKHEHIPSLITANSAEDAAFLEKKRSAQGESRREQMLKRLSNPVESLSNYTKSGISSGINATKSGFNKVLATPKNIVEFSSGLVRDAKDAMSHSTSSSKSDSLETDKDIIGAKGTISFDHKRHSDNHHHFDNRHSCSIGYQNMADTKIDVFANFENLGFHFEEFELIPRPARSCEDPPLYLCLRMGRPINKKLQKFSPAIFSFGKKKIEREYWFSVPKEKADHLFHFFLRWAPQVYGDVDDLTGCEERGLAPIDTDDEEDEDVFEGETCEEATIDGVKSESNAAEKNRPRFWRRRGPLNFLKLVEGRFTADGVSPEWEVVSSTDVRSQFDYMTEFAFALPELIGASDILDEDHRTKLCKHLPARAEGYSWKLIYSSSQHGFSLMTLYREMIKYETPVLLVIQDTFGNVFGALTSSPLRLSDHFYGTGETFLFTFHPEFQCFPWTGENLYFIKGNTDSISIGAGDGNFGLWLDGDINHGRSHPCKTFGNTMLSTHEDFVVKALECWGFV